MTDKIKILYAEDEIDIRESIASILESEGFEVLQAENGQQALELFLDNHPDIVVSDIMMPDFSGYELLEAIRENQNIDNSNVPFILLSALGQKEDIIKGITLEASDYVVKPVDFDLLIAKIKTKTSNLRRIQENNKKNIANLKSQVSNIVPQEMLQYVDTINKISAALKSEIYGPLPHQKYLDDINKIYIHSLKLKTMVSNFLSGEAISNQIDVSDEIINPLIFLQNFFASLNKKFSSQIMINEVVDDKLPDIKINKMVLTEVVKKVVGCLFKINEEMKINIAITNSHLDCLTMIFYPDSKIENDLLVNYIAKTIPSSVLDSQGLSLEVLPSSSNITNLVLSIPNYRVVRKR